MNDLFDLYEWCFWAVHFFHQNIYYNIVNPAFVAYKYSRSMTIPPRQLPLDNYSHEISPRTILPGLLTPPTPPHPPPRTHTHTHKCPWITAPWTTTTRTIVPQGNYPSVFCPSDNCTWIIPPWTTYPQTIDPMKLPPGQLSAVLIPPDNCPWIIPPWTTPPDNYPLWSPPGQLTPGTLLLKQLLLNGSPGQLPPDNYPHEIPVYNKNRNTKESVKLMIYGNKAD